MVDTICLLKLKKKSASWKISRFGDDGNEQIQEDTEDT